MQKLEKKKKKRNSQDDERALVPILQSFDRQAIEPILSAMNQGQIEIRVASWVLSGIKSLRYEELSYLLDSDSMQDRMDGINIMSSLFGHRASAPEGLRVKIAQMIALDPEEKIRRRACHTLTYYGRSEFAVKSLFENARSNSMDSIRSACLQCLCRISSESCSQEELFDLLADRIRNDSSVSVRKAALLNLSQFKGKSDKCMAIYMTALKNEGTAWTAFTCLKDFGADAASSIPDLLRLAQGKADSDIARQIFEYIDSMAPRNSAAVFSAIANLHLLVERELRQQEHSQGPPRYICATGPRPYDRGSEINHLIGIIAANPKLARSAIPDLRVLLNNYRDSVREAAREALSKLNEG